MKYFIAAATILTLTGTAMHAEKIGDAGIAEPTVEAVETNMVSNTQLGAGLLLAAGAALLLGGDDATTTTTTTTTTTGTM